MIADEIRAVYKTANFARQDLFSFCSYRSFAMVYFKIRETTENSLEQQLLHLCRNLIANSTISVDSVFHNNEIQDINVAYLDISDAYHNKLCIVVYTKDFRNTIIEHNGVKFTPATILPPEKRIRIFTKESNPMEIEKGCTALDFAFVLKTDIGVCYNGAEINGEPVEMDFVFQSGEQITIIKANDPIARLD